MKLTFFSFWFGVCRVTCVCWPLGKVDYDNYFSEKFCRDSLNRILNASLIDVHPFDMIDMRWHLDPHNDSFFFFNFLSEISRLLYFKIEDATGFAVLCDWYFEGKNNSTYLTQNSILKWELLVENSFKLLDLFF